MGQSPRVELDLRGHPLHSRAITVTLHRSDAASLCARAELVDLRKRGFVAVGGDLQTSGLIHHMQVEALVDRETLVLREVRVEQPTVPFPPSAVTRGESCRDPAKRLEPLVGRKLDAGFASRVNAEIGGPRGCTHVLTLAQLLGSTLSWACEKELARFGPSPAREPGERIFRRDLVFDGALDGASRVGLVGQLGDLHFRPAPELTRPIDRLAEQLDLRLVARADVATLALEHLEAAQRRRGPEDLERAGWESPAEDLAELLGTALRPGVSGALVRRFDGRSAQRPLLDALLNLTPAFYQCLATVSEVHEQREPGIAGMGAPPDSCYMWRRGGALDRLREAEARRRDGPDPRRRAGG